MRVLFCNELGEGTGHFAPYLSLLDALAQRGWQVTVAARTPGEVASIAHQRGFTLLQAPISTTAFAGLDSASYSYTEILHHFGYAHEATLGGLYLAWKNLLSLIRPDLVLANAAPTAHLAAQSLGIPLLAVGSGFNCPPALDPLPLIRDWRPGIEARIEASENLARRTVDAVLGAFGDSRPAAWQGIYQVPSLLCTLPELDHFPSRPAGGRYIGMLPTAGAVSSLVEGPACDVFVYFRVNQFIESLLADLRRLGLRTTVYCADMSHADRTRWRSAGLDMLDRPADLRAVLPHCRLVVGYAGHNLTAETLLAGKPMLLLPVHLEQDLTAQNVVRLGAGLAVRPGERNPKFRRLLERLLGEAAFTDAAAAFASRYRDWTAERALGEALSACDETVASATPRLRRAVQ
jgi:UDP:flavonoid glycosyltransferase YjiC (YdhE family)